jgi:hypothetical protein
LKWPSPTSSSAVHCSVSRLGRWGEAFMISSWQE